MSMEQLWPAVLGEIEKRVSQQNFSTWFLPLKFLSQEGNVVYIGVSNRFTRDWITDHNFKDIIQQEFASLASQEIRVQLRVLESSEPLSGETLSATPEPVSDKSLSTDAVFDTGLNPRYTFSQFVVGSSNQLAYAASINVAGNPGSTYNPLFLYAGPGLGKTHLLNAIGHMIIQERRHLKVLYLSSETFVNEMVNCLRLNKMDVFHAKYRSNCDVLLIDDIEFISGKERTQEEFFHTFNALHESRRQIVITSDSYPQEIPELEDRLRTRFQWGLIADIQPPEIETRIAILQKKAEIDRLDIPDDVALFIASSVKSNIREIEGSLKRLGALSSMYGKPITLDFAKEVLRDTLGNSSTISIEDVQKAVGNYYNVKVNDLRGNRRNRSICRPRQIAMYICRSYLNSATFPDIGMHFNKDHSTVINAVRNVSKLVKTDNSVQEAVDVIKRQLGI